MSLGKPKICAHLACEDGTNKDINVTILKRVSRKQYLCEIAINASDNNKSLSVCKNGEIVLDIECPKKCPSGCDCKKFTLQITI